MFVAGFTVFSVLNHSYSAPFGTVAGQVVLALVALLYAGGLVWLHRLGNLRRRAGSWTTPAPWPGHGGRPPDAAARRAARRTQPGRPR